MAVHTFFIYVTFLNNIKKAKAKFLKENFCHTGTVSPLAKTQTIKLKEFT